VNAYILKANVQKMLRRVSLGSMHCSAHGVQKSATTSTSVLETQDGLHKPGFKFVLTKELVYFMPKILQGEIVVGICSICLRVSWCCEKLEDD
jgi:hypothetical protein